MLQKFELEYEIMTSPRVLFPFLSTEIGLSEWFANNVTFYFDDIETGRANSNLITGDPMNILAELQIDGGFSTSDKMVIDYIRVYEYP